MRLLYLTYDGLTDPLGQSQVLPYIRGLRQRLKAQFEPDILSFEKESRYQKLGLRLHQDLRGEGIGWYPQTFHKNPPILAKVYDNWTFMRSAWRLSKKNSYEVYHARSYVGGWVAHRLSKRTGRPWVFDMRGFWVDERRENGLWPQGHPLYDWLYKTWKQREQIMLHSATEIIVLTEAAQELLIEWGVPPQKISVIPCVADYDFFQLSPEEHFAARQTVREALHIPAEALVLLYSGSVAAHYAPEDIVAIFEAAYALNSQTFLLVLTLDEPHSLTNLIERRGLPLSHCRVTSAPRSEVPRYFSAADLGIATVKPTFPKIASSFTKIAEYLAADLPVIATAIGDVGRLAQRLPGLFPYQHPNEIPLAVSKLLHFYYEGKGQLSAPLSTLSRPLLSLEVGLDRYQAVYERLFQLVERRRRTLIR